MRITSLSDAPFEMLPYRTAGRHGGVDLCGLPFQRGRVEGLPDSVAALVATSDLQGRELDGDRLLGEVAAEYLEGLARQGRIPPLSATGVLLAGDFYACPTAETRGASGEVSPVWRAFAARARWVCGVLGNHDVLDAPEGSMDEAVLLDNSAVERDGLRVAGLSGIVGRAGRRLRRDEESFSTAVDALVRDGPDVVLLHESPNGSGDEQPGRPEVREALRRSVGRRPSTVVVSGHAYWSRALAQLAPGLQALNVDGRMVVLERA